MGFYSEFAEHYEKIFPCRPATVDFLHRVLPPGGRILDVGCGTGGVLAALIARGRSGLGIDPDPEMVVAAREAHSGLEFRTLGMENLGVLEDRRFDGIYCVGNVLPHLPIRELGGLLETVHDLLVAGGAWVVQTVNFDPLLEKSRHDFPPIEIPADGLSFWRTYLDIDETALTFATRLEQRGRVLFEGEVELYPRRAEAYERMHADAGFRMEQRWGDFSGTPYAVASSTGTVMVFRR